MINCLLIKIRQIFFYVKTEVWRLITTVLNVPQNCVLITVSFIIIPLYASGNVRVTIPNMQIVNITLNIQNLRTVNQFLCLCTHAYSVSFIHAFFITLSFYTKQKSPFTIFILCLLFFLFFFICFIFYNLDSILSLLPVRQDCGL